MSDKRVLEAWQDNAEPWVEAVRAGQIASRRLVTDDAIVQAVLARTRAGDTVLDLGCGEGWLCRALAGHGLRLIGVDAVPELIQSAREAGGADYEVLTYRELATASPGRFPPLDLVVSNFALIGDEDVAAALAVVPALLRAGGQLVIQTLHPVMACGDQPYRDGWREGSWQGCGDGFRQAAPWYFRTLAGWFALLDQCGLQCTALLEPVHPATNKPASVLWVATLCQDAAPG